MTGWSEVDGVILVAHRIADSAGVKGGVVLWLHSDVKHSTLELFRKAPRVAVPGVVERLTGGDTGQDQVTAVVGFLCLIALYVRLRHRI